MAKAACNLEPEPPIPLLDHTLGTWEPNFVAQSPKPTSTGTMSIFPNSVVLRIDHITSVTTLRPKGCSQLSEKTGSVTLGCVGWVTYVWTLGLLVALDENWDEKKTGTQASDHFSRCYQILPYKDYENS